MKRLTLKTVNAEIQKKYPGIELVKGEGYFYVSSDHHDLALQLAGLYTTSINVYALNHLNMDQWLSNVEYILNDNDRVKPGRTPVIFKK